MHNIEITSEFEIITCFYAFSFDFETSPIE